MQINVIDTNSKEYGLAMMYLEKIFGQSIFDCHFYNESIQNNFYDKNVMNAAVELLNIRIRNRRSQCPQNILSLFNHWCEAKKVLNFEAIFLEKHKMNKDLQHIIFSGKIKIQSNILINKLFPNLESYYDI
eukprot:170819_1